MAETRISDCPSCGRANVVGYRDDGKGMLKSVWGICGAVVGGALLGPLGIVGGALAADKAADAVADSGDGDVVYKFKCPNPNCRHEWVRYYPKVK